VYAVFGIYCTRCTRCMLYLVLTHDHSIERDDLTSCSKQIVELKTQKRDIREDRGNDHEKLGLGELGVQVNLPFPIQQVGVPIWW